ncbi:TRAP transporter small permease [Ramlibacter sp. 2FC]|uniref:TRAP transporter small permease n=1 Tax=Ramlibacter sp. 2FC TaxID=2502188 RepID=UPI0010F6DD82|nr:TRAP transporter small permease [Ramlibacter sp. 2FC]
MLRILRSVIDRLLQAGLIACFTVLWMCVVWQVVSRYVLGNPSTFTEETSRFAVIWLSLLGTAYACGRLEHMAYDMLAEKLQGQALLRHMRAIAALVLAFAAAVFVYGGMRLVLRAFEVEQLSATLELPMGWVYSCIPIAGVCIVFYELAILLQPEAFRPVSEVEEALEHVKQELPA